MRRTRHYIEHINTLWLCLFNDLLVCVNTQSKSYYVVVKSDESALPPLYELFQDAMEQIKDDITSLTSKENLMCITMESLFVLWNQYVQDLPTFLQFSRDEYENTIRGTAIGYWKWCVAVERCLTSFNYITVSTPRLSPFSYEDRHRKAVSNVTLVKKRPCSFRW